VRVHARPGSGRGRWLRAGTDVSGVTLPAGEWRDVLVEPAQLAPIRASRARVAGRQSGRMFRRGSSDLRVPNHAVSAAGRERLRAMAARNDERGTRRYWARCPRPLVTLCNRSWSISLI